MKATDHLNSSSLTKNRAESAIGTPCGERDSFFVGSENKSYWHTPKHPSLRLSRALSYDGSKSLEKFRSGYSQSVEACLKNVCNVFDFRQRLTIFLNPSCLEEVLSTMIKLTKVSWDSPNGLLIARLLNIKVASLVKVFVEHFYGVIHVCDSYLCHGLLISRLLNIKVASLVRVFSYCSSRIT